MDIYNDIGDYMRNKVLKYERIRSLRIDKGFTQVQIAEILHVKQNTYCQYGTGVLNYPLDAAVRPALFYNVSIDYLAGITMTPNPISAANNNC